MIDISFVLLYDADMIKEKRKRDYHSHHQNNYLVLFIKNDYPIKKALINAKDKKNALRIGLNRFCKLYPEEDIIRARVSAVYPNTQKNIILKKRL